MEWVTVWKFVKWPFKWIKIPAWEKLKDIPDRVTALESRVAELEKKLEVGPIPICPFCHKGEQHLIHRENYPMADTPHEKLTWECKNPECKKNEVKVALLK